MSYQWATATHKGMVRSANQDSAYPETAGRSDDGLLALIADGMGGHVAGEVASRLATERAVATEGSPVERVVAANDAILDETTDKPELAGMGTTMTLVELDAGGVAHLAHVGDSRAYLLRDGTLRQLTVDHTVVHEYVLTGKITAEEALTHPQRSMLTRALGLSRAITVDSSEEPLQPGDRLLLCSDGVNSMIGDDSIAEALGSGTPEEAVWDLVERANRAGGHDNVTALVVDVEP